MQASVVLVCGEGLRSLLAAEQLHASGYAKVAWVRDGLAQCLDFPADRVDGEVPLCNAGVAGFAGVFTQLADKISGFAPSK